MKSTVGGEEKVSSLWLRFHPAAVGDLFPARTVKGRGDPRAIHWANRVYWARINDCWQAEAAPVIPWRRTLVVTADTTSGGRHRFIIDTQSKTAEHDGGTAVPPPPADPIQPAEALQAFDGAWAEFDRTYAKFDLRPEVDWDALKARYRPVAAASTTAWEAAGAVALLLSPLRDLHVNVEVRGEWVPGYYRPRMLNAHWKATQDLLGGAAADDGKGVARGRTKDGIGYLCVWSLSDPGVVEAFDAGLEALADAWALVVDLRFNGGGGEDLALAMAGRIVDEERVYSVNRYRSGPKRGDLGPLLERRCPPRGPWRWRGPVVVLQGPKTFSSAESFALMLSVCPEVTSMGDRTGGSSANPVRVDLPGGITVNVPRWNDMLPDGTPLEDRGAPPEVPVPGGLRDFDGKDPVMAAALERLRKIPKSKRLPGKREK